jgi:hypothetical protein
MLRAFLVQSVTSSECNLMIRMRIFILISHAIILASVKPTISIAQTAAGSPAAAVSQAPIDRNGVILLTKSALIALDQANKTGNYTVLRDLAAPGFAATNNAARLSEIFANLRRDRIDLSGVLVLDPQLTTLPQIDKNGIMHFSGFFPSAPSQINFELFFAPVEGQWRLFGIGARLGSLNPSAPNPPAPMPQPAKKPDSKKP